jgi:hypothetical protein
MEDARQRIRPLIECRSPGVPPGSPKKGRTRHFDSNNRPITPGLSATLKESLAFEIGGISTEVRIGQPRSAAADSVVIDDLFSKE